MVTGEVSALFSSVSIIGEACFSCLVVKDRPQPEYSSGALCSLNKLEGVQLGILQHTYSEERDPADFRHSKFWHRPMIILKQVAAVDLSEHQICISSRHDDQR